MAAKTNKEKTMKILTKDLKALVAKVQRGIGNNPLMPLSGLVSVGYDGAKKVTLKTFDGYNYVISGAEIAESTGAGDVAFEACVNANVFVALVNKTTSEGISIDLAEKYVAFKGNGNYKLDVVFDNGQLLLFPEMEDFSEVEGDRVRVSTLLNSINVNETSVAKTAEVPMFLGCYFGERVYTTNGQVACVVEDKLVEGKNALFMYNTMKLLPSLVDQEATLKVKDGQGERLFELSDSGVTISGKLISDGGKYPVGALDKMVGDDMPSVSVGVAGLLDVLDRMNIFTDQYQTSAIRLTFADGLLTVTNYTSGGAHNAEETIDAPHVEGTLPIEGGKYECFVDLGQLQADLKVCAQPTATLGFGSKTFIRVNQGKVTFIIGLLDVKR